MAGGDFRKASCTCVEDFHHLGRGSLLWGEHMGCAILTTEWIADIGGDGESDITEGGDLIP